MPYLWSVSISPCLPELQGSHFCCWPWPLTLIGKGWLKNKCFNIIIIKTSVIKKSPNILLLSNIQHRSAWLKKIQIPCHFLHALGAKENKRIRAWWHLSCQIGITSVVCCYFEMFIMNLFFLLSPWQKVHTKCQTTAPKPGPARLNLYLLPSFFNLIPSRDATLSAHVNGIRVLESSHFPHSACTQKNAHQWYFNYE